MDIRPARCSPNSYAHLLPAPRIGEPGNAPELNLLCALDLKKDAALAKHNEQVLRECLGWSRDSIGKLAKEGVLSGKQPEPGVEP